MRVATEGPKSDYTILYSLPFVDREDRIEA